MDTKIFILVFIFLLPLSCNSGTQTEEQLLIRSDFRFGNKFYSLCIKNNYKAVVIRGQCTNSFESFHVESSDTSNEFYLDSAQIFIANLNHFIKNPLLEEKISFAQRVEVYHMGTKVYDVSTWDATFWKLFNPIILQLPNGFNPFVVKDNIFYSEQ